jgi:hypothetical protein
MKSKTMARLAVHSSGLCERPLVSDRENCGSVDGDAANAELANRRQSAVILPIVPIRVTNAAPGVDGITWEEYESGLDGPICTGRSTVALIERSRREESSYRNRVVGKGHSGSRPWRTNSADRPMASVDRPGGRAGRWSRDVQRRVSKAGKPVAHTLYAFKDSIGRLLYSDRTGAIVKSPQEL